MAENAELAVTERSRLRRVRERGHYDRETVYAILDAMPLCHIGYIQNGVPIVMPTFQWREGDHLYWHASNGGRGIKAAQGNEVCVTVSILDGLVLARSGLHHSANYRSVMVFGKPQVVSGEENKRKHLNTMIDTLYPGRSEILRPMSEEDLKQTRVLSLPLEEASAKVRTGGVIDDEEDYELPIWAGTLPLTWTAQTPIPDPRNLPDVEMPEHIVPPFLHKT